MRRSSTTKDDPRTRLPWKQGQTRSPPPNQQECVETKVEPRKWLRHFASYAILQAFANAILQAFADDLDATSDSYDSDAFVEPFTEEQFAKEQEQLRKTRREFKRVGIVNNGRFATTQFASACLRVDSLRRDRLGGEELVEDILARAEQKPKKL